MFHVLDNKRAYFVFTSSLATFSYSFRPMGVQRRGVVTWSIGRCDWTDNTPLLPYCPYGASPSLRESACTGIFKQRRCPVRIDMGRRMILIDLHIMWGHCIWTHLQCTCTENTLGGQVVVGGVMRGWMVSCGGAHLVMFFDSATTASSFITQRIALTHCGEQKSRTFTPRTKCI